MTKEKTKSDQAPLITLYLQSRDLGDALSNHTGLTENRRVMRVQTQRAAECRFSSQSSHILLLELEAMIGADCCSDDERTLLWLLDISRRCAGLRTIVLSSRYDAESVVAAVRHGASGYLVRDPQHGLQHAVEMIATGVRELAAGNAPISPAVAHHLVAAVKGEHGDITLRETNKRGPAVAQQPAAELTAQLSKREIEVLKLAAKGFSYAEMAGLLNLSVHTISSYTRRIYSKFEVNSRGEAVYEASRQGLLGELAVA